MVASQIQLREEMNLIVKQFQNLKGGQEENKIDHNPLTMEGEKKINERINKVEEMIKRARKMEELMNYQSFSFFPDVRLLPKFKMPTLDKFDRTGCPKSYLKMYMRAMQPLGATKELLAQMFQNTLTGATLRLFLNLDDARATSWVDIFCKFHNQYKYNIEVDVTRRDLETTKQEPKESFFAFITKWRSKTPQMMNRPNEENQLTIVVKNLLPIYHKYCFAWYFPNFKALIATSTQIEDAINNGTIKNKDAPKFKKNFRSSSKTAKVSDIYKKDPYQLIAPMQISQRPPTRPRREFHKLYMPVSQVFEKLKAKGLLKPLDPKPILNPSPVRFDVSKRCAYHQVPGHDTNKCYSLCHAIIDLIDTKVITLPTRSSITNNPLPNHNFGRGAKINCLMIEEEGEEDPSKLIYDLPECFMMTWEELMGMTSIAGYDIWHEDAIETLNYPTSTYEGRHFKPQSSYQTPTYGGRHFEPQSNDPTSAYGGRHFKPQDTELNDPSKIAHITIGGRHFKPPHLETDNPIKALKKFTQQIPTEEDEVLKQLQKT